MTLIETATNHGPQQGADRARLSLGFTIIELLVVMTLLLAMTAIVAPTFRMSPSSRVDHVARTMAVHLELARSEAMGSRRLVRVSVDTTAGTYTAYTDHDKDGTITSVTAEIEAFPQFGVRELPDLVVFGRGSASAFPGDLGTESVTLPGSQVFLSTQGIPVPQGTMGTIYITHSRDQSAVAAISVASSGSFRAWRWAPDVGEWR